MLSETVDCSYIQAFYYGRVSSDSYRAPNRPLSPDSGVGWRRCERSIVAFEECEGLCRTRFSQLTSPQDDWAVYELLVTGTILAKVYFHRNQADAAIRLSENLLNLTMADARFGLTSEIGQGNICYLWQLYNHQGRGDDSRNGLLLMKSLEERGVWLLGPVEELQTIPSQLEPPEELEKNYGKRKYVLMSTDGLDLPFMNTFLPFLEEAADYVRPPSARAVRDLMFAATTEGGQIAG